MTMTTAELKKQLEELPDDMPVYLYDPTLDTYFPLLGRMRKAKIITDATGFHIDSPIPENPNLGKPSVAVIMG